MNVVVRCWCRRTNRRPLNPQRQPAQRRPARGNRRTADHSTHRGDRPAETGQLHPAPSAAILNCRFAASSSHPEQRSSSQSEATRGRAKPACADGTAHPWASGVLTTECRQRSGGVPHSACARCRAERDAAAEDVKCKGGQVGSRHFLRKPRCRKTSGLFLHRRLPALLRVRPIFYVFTLVSIPYFAQKKFCKNPSNPPHPSKYAGFEVEGVEGCYSFLRKTYTRWHPLPEASRPEWVSEEANFSSRWAVV